MQLTTVNSNPVHILQYHLYKNTFDDTYVIVANHLQDVFERTLTNMGSAPLLLKTDHSLSELQMKAIQYGINADVISSLN
jgi:RNA-binding protein YlmH